MNASRFAWRSVLDGMWYTGHVTAPPTVHQLIIHDAINNLTHSAHSHIIHTYTNTIHKRDNHDTQQVSFPDVHDRSCRKQWVCQEHRSHGNARIGSVVQS